jgi:5-methylcytosine-specific restriction endonuclease McrA
VTSRWQFARKDPAYGSAEWKRARAACLKRARWRCELAIEGVCTGTATEADHLLGLANDPQHTALAAACKPCHQQRTAAQGNEAKRRRAALPFTPRTQW